MERKEDTKRARVTNLVLEIVPEDAHDQPDGALYAATMRAVAPPSRDSSMSALACSKTGTATRTA